VIDKLDYYDILGIIIPGTLVAYWISICFPQLAEIAAGAALPEPIDIIAFVALAFFLGHILQGVAGAMEPALFWSWRGRPSDRALRDGLGDWYLPKDAGLRIRAKLAAVVGADASERSLFLRAMSLANAFPGSRRRPSTACTRISAPSWSCCWSESGCSWRRRDGGRQRGGPSPGSS
jgi:hypothetical protein